MNLFICVACGTKVFPGVETRRRRDSTGGQQPLQKGLPLAV